MLILVLQLRNDVFTVKYTCFSVSTVPQSVSQSIVKYTVFQYCSAAERTLLYTQV